MINSEVQQDQTKFVFDELYCVLKNLLIILVECFVLRCDISFVRIFLIY